MDVLSVADGITEPCVVLSTIFLLSGSRHTGFCLTGKFLSVVRLADALLLIA